MDFKKQNRWAYGNGGRIRKGNKPQETLNDREQTVDWPREVGGRWARWVLGTKEGTCCDEHWVLYVRDESWNQYCTVCQLKFKLKTMGKND